MEQKNKVPVCINGVSISVITDESPEHIESLAAYINELIDRFQASKNCIIAPNLLFLYAALELCNEFFHKSKELAAIKKEYSEFVETFDIKNPSPNPDGQKKI